MNTRRLSTRALALLREIREHMSISKARAIMREYPRQEDYIDAYFSEDAYRDRDGHTVHRDNSLVLSLTWEVAREVCEKYGDDNGYWQCPNCGYYQGHHAHCSL